MKIAYFGNNLVGWKILSWLKEQNEDVVCLFVHPPENQKYGREIIRTANLDPEWVFHATVLRNRNIRESILRLKPDIGISAFFGYILRKEIIELFPKGVINIHPSYLPHNRGAYPNVWSIVDGTPAGVTIHYLDEGIDTGDIIAQREVEVKLTDTGQSLYRRLERESIELFKDKWHEIKMGNFETKVQDPDVGTHHFISDVESIDRIELERTYKARDLINIVRARTFPPHKGAYIEVNGKRIYLELNLWCDD